MFEIQNIDHVVIRAGDAEAMIRFYCDVLGCAVERTLAPELGLTQLRAGRALIDIVSVQGEIGRSGGAAPGREGRNMDHFCVRVAPFDEAAIRAHLAKHGVTAGELATRYGAEGSGPSLYLQDPEGNTVELKGPAQ